MTARRRLRVIALGLLATAVIGSALPLSASASSRAAQSAITASSTGRPSTPITLSVMTQNMFYGGDDYDLETGGFCAVADGCPQALHRIADTIVASGADVVGLQETERNTVALADLIGWYASPRGHVISRYPIIEPPGSDGMYVWVAPTASRVVAVANFHLPSTPYGPYDVRDGKTLAQVLKLERTLRVSSMKPQLAVLSQLIAQGYPVFVTGDFNSPSYLDWTPAVAQVRSDVKYPVKWPVSVTFAQAGFGDSYRDVHPDPVATPGFTWTPGGPETDPHEVYDRIDWVLHAGPVTTLDSRLIGEAGGADVELPVAAPYPSDHRGVVSTFRVDAVKPAPFAATQQRRIVPGQHITVRWQLGSGPDQRVGLVRRAADGADIWVRSLTPKAAFDKFSFGIGDLAPGDYDVVLADHGGSRILSRQPVHVYPRGAGATVTTSRAVYRVGQRIGVSWTGAPGQGLDWIGLFPCNATTGRCGGNGTYLLYQYTQTRIEGSLTIGAERGGFEDISAAWPLPPGRYVARLLVDDSYHSIGASEQFTIVP